MTSQIFINKVRKNKKLYDEGIYNYTEFTQQTDDVINELQFKDMKFNKEDFLLDISSLVSETLINQEQLTKIKELISEKGNESEQKINQEPDFILINEQKPEEEKFYERVNPTSNYQPKQTEPVFNPSQPISQKTTSNAGVFLMIVGVAILGVIIYVSLGSNKNITSSTNTTSQNSSSNTNSNTNTNTPSNTSNNTREILSEPCKTVNDWVLYLGSQNYYKAYNLMRGKKWGDYNFFNSTKSYGGISRTNFISCYTSSNGSYNSEVIAEYEAYDPYNSDGKYKQTFFLEKISSSWYIKDIKNIDRTIYREK